jgi:hypothetical protein
VYLSGHICKYLNIQEVDFWQRYAEKTKVNQRQSRWFPYIFFGAGDGVSNLQPPAWKLAIAILAPAPVEGTSGNGPDDIAVMLPKIHRAWSVSMENH